MLDLEGGRASEPVSPTLLARLLGRCASLVIVVDEVAVEERSSGGGRGPPNDKRLTCTLVLVDLGVGGGRPLPSSCLVEELVLLLARLFLFRTVMLLVMKDPPGRAPIRGEPLGVVAALGVFAFGGGSLERTECTLSSIFCILPIKPLI